MSSYDAIVIGGGVIGVSIAYHVARLGGGRVLLLERGQLGGGTTAQSSCIVRTHYSVPENVALAQTGLEAFERLRRVPRRRGGRRRVHALRADDRRRRRPARRRAARDAGRRARTRARRGRDRARRRAAHPPAAAARRHRRRRLGAAVRLRGCASHADGVRAQRAAPRRDAARRRGGDRARAQRRGPRRRRGDDRGHVHRGRRHQRAEHLDARARRVDGHRPAARRFRATRCSRSRRRSRTRATCRC